MRGRLQDDPSTPKVTGGRTFRSDIRVSNINRALAPEELILLFPYPTADRLGIVDVATSLLTPTGSGSQ